jgi:hypothetical protein
LQDLRHFFFENAKEQNQRRNMLDHLTRLVFPFSISKADITNPLQFFGVSVSGIDSDGTGWGSLEVRSKYNDCVCLL